MPQSQVPKAGPFDKLRAGSGAPSFVLLERGPPSCAMPAKPRLRGARRVSIFLQIPRLTEEQLSNLVRPRGGKRKVAVSVRLDPQVLDWLRSKGEGRLTRINDILSNLMEAERRVGREIGWPRSQKQT